MSIAEWRDEYCTHHVQIDSQHRQLFDLVNRIHDLILATPEEFARIVELLHEFAQCAQDHFDLEESLMQSYGYPHFDMHCKVHQRLVNKVTNLLAAADADTLTLETLTQVLASWMVHHIQGEDQRMIRYFQAQHTFQADTALVSVGQNV